MPGFNGPSEIMTVNGNLQLNDDGTGNYGKIISGPLAAPLTQLQATTGVNGFALINGTPTILSWTAPNDGQVHRVWLIAQENVTSPETGGQVNLNFRDLQGNAQSRQAIPGGAGNGFTGGFTPMAFLVQAGQTVSAVQGTALTAGAATVWAELWAS